MFTEQQRFKILSHLDKTINDMSEIWTALDRVENTSQALIDAVLSLVDEMNAVLDKRQLSGTDEAGLTRVDVLEFDPCQKTTQINRQRYALKRKLAKLIGVSVDTEVEGVF
jgi:hypothetical protein